MMRPEEIVRKFRAGLARVANVPQPMPPIIATPKLHQLVDLDPKGTNVNLREHKALVREWRYGD